MELKKGLGLPHVFCIASGAMISSGLFVLPGLAHARAGPAVILSYLLAGLLAFPGLLCVAELTTAMPKAGGDYFFVTRGMGPAVGTVAGILNWFSLSLKSGFALVGLAAFLQLLVPVDYRLLGLALSALFVVVNLVGVREAARLQVALVMALLALLAVFVFAGLGHVQSTRIMPFAPHGWPAVFSTAGFVFVSYGGLLKISSVAEEVRRPGRVIPMGLFLSLGVVLTVYSLAVLVTSGVMSDEKLHNTLMPISDAAGAFMGNAGQIALTIGAILAFMTTANAGIMSASRYLLAMSRDELLPRRLARVSPRFQTPQVALAITGAVVALSLLVQLESLIKAASTVLILTHIGACLSVIVLREGRVQNYRPRFRSPLYPWVQLAGILGLVFVLLEMGLEAYLVAAALIVASFCLYWFYGRTRWRRESALLHLIQRITARELVTGSLERELKEIVRERDQIVLDRFDTLIENSAVLDLPGPVEAEEFFRQAAEQLGPRVGIESKDLRGMLSAREKDSSTVLGANLAIPHVVIDQSGRFDILLARCREGIVFPNGRKVQAAFVMVGSRDQRNFHLRALAAIAQVTQEQGFAKNWLSANGPQALRDAVLLAERQRFGEH
ncbi:MAG: putative amino acid permease YhdG [Planctomycetes bacterium ADurb.Bin126]|nr:MAG: putative amino acid permease YhdG [Planctomycetes bacterium ADurb.Bin126]HOD84005.1 amino acid permease [Phycisphaerae bacterium]HQL75736.1 amino acid permease [Phycisphaerae bacterium]